MVCMKFNSFNFIEIDGMFHCQVLGAGDKAFIVVPVLSSSKYTWKIPNLSQLSEEKIYFDVFIVGGCKWRLIIFPKGNRGDNLSIYLDVPDYKDLPNGWNRNVKLRFSVINHFDKSATVCKDTWHVFNEKECCDWGFTSFIPLSKVKSPAERYLVHDILTVEGVVSVVKAVHKSKDDEKNVIKLEECKALQPLIEAPPSQTRLKCNTEGTKVHRKGDAHLLATSKRLLAELSNRRKKLKLNEILDSIQAPDSSNIHNAKANAEAAEARRSSLSGKTEDLYSKVEQRQKEISSLESEFSTLSGEEAKLRAETVRVVAKRKLVSDKLERANVEACREIEECRRWEAETKQANAKFFGAKEKLALANVRWDRLREDLGL